MPPRTRATAWPGPRLRAALAAGRAVGAAYRLSRRRGDGIALRGKAILTVDPSALQRLSRGRLTTLVSGTNGKTTTTHLAVAALGGGVLTNAMGTNTRNGVVAAFAAGDSPVAVVEVDELHLPAVIEETRPRVVIALNLSRDQLDRTHEVAAIVGRWRRAFAGAGATIVANAADPNVVAAVGEADAVWFDPVVRWTADAAACPTCGRLLTWADDSWSCACGLGMPRPHWRLRGADVVGPDGVGTPLTLSVPGSFNRGNALAALAAAHALGVPPGVAAERIGAVTSAAGRFARVAVGGRPARLVLAKNPAGWTAAMPLAAAADQVVVSLNAGLLDGRDTSWIYDVPFELLVGRVVGVTGDRRHDLALRLRYAGIDTVVDADPDRLLRDRLPPGNVTLVANYTAFQHLRRREDG